MCQSCQHQHGSPLQSSQSVVGAVGSSQDSTQDICCNALELVETVQSTRPELQSTFGAIVGLEPLVPVEPSPAVCTDCGEETAFERDASGDNYCEDCYKAAYDACSNCDKECGHDDITNAEDGDGYCHDCYHEKFTTCRNCSTEIEIGGSDEYASNDGHTYCESCYDDRYFSCSGCSQETRQTDCVSSEDGDSYCETCYCDRYCNCADCDCEISRDNSYSNDNGTYCESCYPGDEDQEESEWSGRISSDGNWGALPFSSKREQGAPSLGRTRSPRRYGVELETAGCRNSKALAGKVHFACKEDGSIDGKEFVSTILSGDAGLAAIEDFCDRAEDAGFTVDVKCGYHAHFDVSDLNDKQLRAVAVAYSLTGEVWQSMVSETRRNNIFCKGNSWKADNVPASGFADWANKLDRYQWINLSAYTKHRTFEVRLHSGTLDACKVGNWVVAHIRFIDYVKDMSLASIKRRFAGKDKQGIFAELCEVWGDADLSAYYARRAGKFGTFYTLPASTPATETPARQRRAVAVVA